MRLACWKRWIHQHRHHTSLVALLGLTYEVQCAFLQAMIDFACSYLAKIRLIFCAENLE